MSWLNGIALLVGAFLAVPVSGRAQQPDIQGRAPLSLDEAIKASKDPNAETRRYAAESVAQLGPMALKAVPFLLHFLKNDSDDDVRAEAARALGRIGHVKGVLPELRAALKHANLIVSVNAAAAIGLLGQQYEAEAVSFLARKLKEIEGNPLDSAPQIVFIALAELGPRAKAVGPALLPWLRSRHWIVRLNVLDVLDAIEDDRDELIRPLVGMISDQNLLGYFPTVSVTVDVVTRPLSTGRLDSSGVTLTDCLESFASIARLNVATREAAIRLLARLGPKAKAAVPVLTRCLKDKRLQGEARKALEAIRGRP